MKKKKIILFLLLISSLLSIYPIYNCIETKIVHEKYKEKYDCCDGMKPIFYGRIDGNIVVYLCFPEYDFYLPDGYYIENFYFRLFYWENIYLYKDKELLTIKKAYELGYISSNDVARIYNRHITYLYIKDIERERKRYIYQIFNYCIHFNHK